MPQLFGTDGVRGVANEELTPELAFRLAAAAAQVLAEEDGEPWLVGRDTRRSGPMLEGALVAGLASAGVDCIRLGVVTTPGVAYLARRTGARAAIVISASHNPAQYNGIKFFSGDGFKLADEQEEAIEARLDLGAAWPSGNPERIGRIEHDEGLVQGYLDHLAGGVPESVSRFRVVLDCANGAAAALAPRLFAQLGVRAHVLFAEPDGWNINRQCGALHPAALQRAVAEMNADMGFAFDGDADRCLAVDERGQLVDGDAILAMLGSSWLRAGRLPGRTVVATVMSNMGLDRALAQLGGRVERTRVGDRYVLERMRAGGYALGGEQSGHIICLDRNTTGDGLVTALAVMSLAAQTGTRLSELASVLQPFPQVLCNVPLPRGSRWEEDEAFQSLVAAAERSLGGEGRVLVRASGTEPVLRIMVEAASKEEAARWARSLAEAAGRLAARSSARAKDA